jgi:hypothetical protein
MGKPSRGQRTWSNAWTAYHYNKVIRNFVVTTQRILNKDKKEEKVNYKLIKKTIKKSSKEGMIKAPKKKPKDRPYRGSSRYGRQKARVGSPNHSK